MAKDIVAYASQNNRETPIQDVTGDGKFGCGRFRVTTVVAVLVKLLNEQKPIRLVDAEENRSLAAYFLQVMNENRLFEVFDAQVLREAEKEEVITVAMVKKRCLNLDGKKRPTMKEVALELAGIRASIGPSFMQQNSEEIDFVDYDNARHFKTGSSSTGSFFNSVTFSVDGDPLLSNKW
ncbi:hypothetical protein WN943_025814 [Citrus x changshan-huyou]